MPRFFYAGKAENYIKNDIYDAIQEEAANGCILYLYQ